MKMSDEKKKCPIHLLHVGYIFIGLGYALSQVTILRCQDK